MTGKIPAKEIHKIILNGRITMEEFIAVARYGAVVEFSDSYIERVKKSRSLVEKWVEEGRVMYGITTGFGALYQHMKNPHYTLKSSHHHLLPPK